MEMSETAGLQKLVEYLKQTRRQAETAIDVLNSKVSQLEKEKKVSDKTIEDLTTERDYFRKLVDQLQEENSRKWKLQERDDWKCLVDSVQQDRTRLQQELTKIEDEFEEAKEEIIFLQEELDRVTLRNSELSEKLGINDSEIVQNLSNNGSRDVFSKENSPVLNSPIMDRFGRELKFDSTSPNGLSKQLRKELKKTQSELNAQQLEVEKVKREKHEEIEKLKKNLKPAKRDKNIKKPQENGYFPSKGVTVFDENSNGLELKNPDDKVKNHSNVSTNWFNPFGLVGFYFFGPSKIGNNSPSSMVLKV